MGLDYFRLLDMEWPGYIPEFFLFLSIFGHEAQQVSVLVITVWILVIRCPFPTGWFSWIIHSFFIIIERKIQYLYISYPIGSMYALYGNIYHQYTPNVSIYTIHGSYGYGYNKKWHSNSFADIAANSPPQSSRLTSRGIFFRGRSVSTRRRLAARPEKWWEMRDFPAMVDCQRMFVCASFGGGKFIYIYI